MTPALEGLTVVVTRPARQAGPFVAMLREAGAEVFILGNSGLFDLDPDLATAWDTMIAGYERATGETVGA